MFIIYLYFTFTLINILDASFRQSKNESDPYLNGLFLRVMRGKPGKLGDVPYQIAFKSLVKKPRTYGTFCGGVIISPTKLLSAAHCFTTDRNRCLKMCGGSPVKQTSLSKKYAVAGHLRNRGWLYEYDKDGQWRTLKSVVYPKTYSFPRDDIAILWTRRPFVYNSHVNSIPIARKYVDYKGSCLVSGFGRISDRAASDMLLLAHLQIIPTRICTLRHRRNMRDFVCTSSAVSDVGKGDSGGPLVCTNTGDPNEVGGRGILVGIVSGNRVGTGSFFARVSSYYRYIQRNKCSTNEIHIRYFGLIVTIHTNFLLF